MQALARSKPLRIKSIWILLLRIVIHGLSLLWLSIVLYQAFTGKLQGDPVQYLLDFTGIATLNLLLLSLAISPLAQYLKFVQIIRVRKTLGVYAAIYALAHLSVFIAFELQFEWALIVSEIIKRPYITVGFAALVILTALLVTSLDAIKRRMGQSWQRLHKWVYVALGLGLLHFLWSIKASEVQPYFYIALGLFALSVRKKKLKNFFK